MLGIVQQLGQLGAPGLSGYSDLKRFKVTGPTTFSGSGGSIQAEEWLRRTEELLVAAEITPARKVEIVRLELTDLARQWWASEADSIIPRPIPWETFVAAFLIRFFPESERSELQRRFLVLIQGTNSVEKYNIEFSTLCRYDGPCVCFVLFC